MALALLLAAIGNMNDARNKILDDVGNVSGLGVAAERARRTAQTLRGMLDTMLKDGALVTREFEVVREMAEKARAASVCRKKSTR